MEKITANHPDSQSADLITHHIEQLSLIFPEVIKEGKVDSEALQDLLGNYTDTSEERFQLNWAGKSQARREAQKRSTGTLRPCPEESVDWDTTENLYIEGDNLEVLKLLQKSYYKKVKMIYIDPPYNTGNDFVYKDNYRDNLANYLAISGQDQLFSTNTENDGRYHSNWLNMMYPRIKLARNLLKDDGVIFISIGEQEVYTLRALCNEIFGEENFIGCAGRISKKANNQGDFWAPNFDYVLTYCKQMDDCSPFFGGINYSAYTQIEDIGERKGEKYQLIRLYMTSLDPLRGCNNQRYYIKCPDGSFVIPPGNTFPEKLEDGSFIPPRSGKDKVWRWTYKSYLENKDKIFIKEVKSSNLVDENGKPAKWNVFTKTYLQDVIDNSTASPNNFIEDQINQKATHELNELDIPFDFAKPSSLISFFADTCRVESNDLVLDFFAGSSSTAQGIISKNAEDGLSRKFVLIQLPEACDINSDEYKVGFKNICEIGKERIRRAGKKIVEELKEKKSKEGALFAEEQKKLDIGFKVFKLDSSNINTWDSSPSNLEGALYNSVQNIKSDRTEHDLLYEILLKYGIDLVQPINEYVLAGKKVYEMGAGALIACMADHVKPETAEAIAKLWKEVKPTAIDESSKAAINCRVVFKDNGFDDNNDKTNVSHILKQHGIDNVVTI